MKDNYVVVELGRVVASKTNPRKHFDATALEELAASIRSAGVIEPLLVRPHGKDGYELVCGERRWRAAKLAKADGVPCVVRELTDDQVLEIQLIENLQRVDVSALEEAEGFKRLIDAGKYTAETLAEKLGKSRSHVFGRLKLVNLSKPVKEALVKGELEASHAALIAAVPGKDAQEELLELVECDRPSVRELKETIAQDYSKNLGKAPWDLADAELVKAAGPCTTCPKRSGNLEPDTKSPNVCTDVGCYGGKAAAHLDRRLAEAKAKGTEVLTAKQWDDYRVRQQYASLDSEAYNYGHHDKTYRQLLKGKEVKTVLAVTGDGLKEVVAYSEVAKLIPKKKQAVSSYDKERREEQGKNRKMRLALQTVMGEVAPKIFEKGLKAEDVKFWRLLATCAALHFRDQSVQGKAGYAEAWLAGQWGLKVESWGAVKDGEIEKHVAGLKTADGLRQAAVVLLTLNEFMDFYHAEAEPGFKAACEWAGFDLPGRLKELLAEKKPKVASATATAPKGAKTKAKGKKTAKKK